ncbi:MAG: APC family permease [Pyrinomonadaceae bacterium]
MSDETTRGDATERGHLLRVLGVAFGLAVTVGMTIGMGILRTPGEVAAHLLDARLIMLAWLLGGLYALLGAVSVAELATLLPHSGGQYVYARHALGAYPGFIVGWSDWLSTCGTVAAVALVVAEYAGALVPQLAGRTLAVALCATVTFALLQWRGVRWGNRAQGLTSLLKTLAFAALIGACFIVGGRGPAAVAPFSDLVPTGWALLGALVLALQGVLYTYDGWTATTYFGGEMHDSARAVPRAMIGGVLTVVAIYLLVNAGLLYVMPAWQLAGDKLAVGTAAQIIFGARAGVVISMLALVSLLAALNANTMAAPRILFAMSRDRLFWARAGAVNEGGTPSVALVVSTLVAVVMLVFSGTFERVLAALAFFFVTNYTLTFLSVFVLRRREPQAKRPYRAWGYPWTTGAVLAGSIAFLIGAVAGDTANSVYALVLLALSYPAFMLLKWGKRVSGD